MNIQRLLPIIFLAGLICFSIFRVVQFRNSAFLQDERRENQKLFGYVWEHPYIKNGIKVIPFGSERINVDKKVVVYLGNYIEVDPSLLAAGTAPASQTQDNKRNETSNNKVTSSQNSKWSGFGQNLSTIKINEAKSIKPLVGLSILRENKIGEVKRQMKYPYSSVVLGLTIGYKEDFSAFVTDMIRRSGLSHIFVVSGYNIQIFLDLIRKIFSKFGKVMFLFVSLNFLFFYTLIVGFDAPVVRASFMGLFSIFGFITGRHKISLYAFFLVIGFLISYYPAYYEDLSFLLSASATYSVLLFNTIFSGRFSFGLNTFFLTLTVNLFILPVTLMYFGTINLTGVISGLMSSFVVEWITLIGFLLILFPLGLTVTLLEYMSDFMLRVVEATSSFSFLYWDIKWLKNNSICFVLLFFCLHLIIYIFKKLLDRRINED